MDVVGGANRVQRAAAADQFLETDAVHVFHDEEMEFAVAVDVVGADDVGMAQLGDGLGLAVEAFDGAGVVGLAGGQHLDGDGPVHDVVRAEVDGAHAAGAERFEDGVLAAEDEVAPTAAEHLIGLKAGEQPFADESVGHLGGRGRRIGPGAGQELVQALGFATLLLRTQSRKSLTTVGAGIGSSRVRGGGGWVRDGARQEHPYYILARGGAYGKESRLAATRRGALGRSAPLRVAANQLHSADGCTHGPR